MKRIILFKSEDCDVCQEETKEIAKVREACDTCRIEVVDIDKQPKRSQNVKFVPTIKVGKKTFVGFTKAEQIINAA